MMNDSFIGSQVAGYRIERMLGRGGMASVYFAWDTRNNRAVALKVLDERYRDTPSYIGRFVQEARAITGWDNPHIVRVFDAGEENQIYYYAMEFVRGLDLAQLLKQYLDAGQLMPYEDVARIGWAVADALDYAHARGIIHRDVKPSNVLVSVDGRILLTDFGLVMDVSRGTLGETFGSPAYIAPEQARNSANAVPQSDLYSLGVMLYEMLTGAVPFHDSSPTALALKHLTEEPPRPREFNPRLSPAVEAVLLRVLRKQPLDRYATGRELMSALERGLGEALTATAVAPLPLPHETQVLQTQRARRAAPAQQAPASGQPSPSMPSPPVFPAARAGSPAQGGTAVSPAYHPQPGPPTRSYNAPPGGSIPYRPAAVPPSGLPPAGAPPAGRSRGFSWGCLAGLLAAGALALVIGAAFAFNRGGFPLFPGAGGGRSATPTEQIPGTATPEPTFTFTPSLTHTPEPTSTSVPTGTPEPTATPTLTFTPTPPAATATQPPPTVAPGQVYQLLLARQKEDGFVLVNAGETEMPLAPLELRSKDDPERVYITGADWSIETLQPGQCVSAWFEGARPSFPSGVRCEPIGKVLFFERNERFWRSQVVMMFNNQRVETCKPDRDRCEFDTRPKPENEN